MENCEARTRDAADPTMTRPLAPGSGIPTDLLLRAYASGVFPMAENADDTEVFWVRPETRGIIPLDGFHMPKSLAKTIRRGTFGIAFDRDFAGVIEGCAERRAERRNTWINRPIREAYARLFEIGHCHTVEAWHEGRLAGGLYGVTLGRVFTDTFAGIAPGSAPAFVGMQLVGLLVGLGLTLALYPDAGDSADDVVIPHRP